MAITIKDWNSLTQEQKETAVKFVYDDAEESGLIESTAKNFIAVKAKLRPVQSIMLSSISKEKDGTFSVKKEIEL